MSLLVMGWSFSVVQRGHMPCRGLGEKWHAAQFVCAGLDVRRNGMFSKCKNITLQLPVEGLASVFSSFLAALEHENIFPRPAALKFTSHE